MASNIVREPGTVLSVVVSNPAAPVTGDPVRYGERTGVALTDEGEGGNGATETTVNFGPFVGLFSVKGIDGSGNSAVAVGDSIYYVDGDTPKLSKKASGYFFGFANGAVGGGDTGTIEVAHVDAGAWSGTVNTGDIANGGVTAVKLSTTLKNGFVPLGIAVMQLLVFKIILELWELLLLYYQFPKR
jgi:predicted RecA/RadA family phage recombinase